MPGFPLTVGTTLSCLHQAPGKVAPSQTAVTISAQSVATAASQIAVAACPFPPGGPPSPCLTIKWAMVSSKVTIQRKPLLVMPPPGSGLAPATGIGSGPQGPASVTVNQTKVTAV